MYIKHVALQVAGEEIKIFTDRIYTISCGVKTFVCSQWKARLTPPHTLLISMCFFLHGDSGDFIAKDFKDQWSELHAMFRQEGDAAILLGMLLVQAPQVCEFLDHFGIEQVVARRRVSAKNIGLQDL
uniref:Uncharacterized protein n=1 Tax=Micrurus spixii TaxID=129469 RepID=A0A2D4LPM0_9SAUR